jgi:hypothetical protein
MAVPLAERTVGPSPIGDLSRRCFASDVVTKVPVAPESRIVYGLWLAKLERGAREVFLKYKFSFILKLTASPTSQFIQ